MERVRCKALEGSGPGAKDIGLAIEKPLWNFSFSYLIQDSLKPMIYVAPYMGAKVMTNRSQDGRSGCTMNCSGLQTAPKERVKAGVKEELKLSAVDRELQPMGKRWAERRVHTEDQPQRGLLCDDLRS